MEAFRLTGTNELAMLAKQLNYALTHLDQSNFSTVGWGISPSGAVTQYAGSSAPTGWLLCDGSAVSRTTYAVLFAVIGTTYGVGDGSTTFNLPNLKGRVPVGLDAAQTEFDTLAETGGAKTHTLTSAEMPVHTHVQDSHVHAQNVSANPGSGGPAYRQDYDADIAGGSVYAQGIDTASATATNQNTGGGTAHNNLQPYIVLNYIIKA